MANRLQKLYPSDEVFQKFSYKDQKKLSNLVVGNLICIALFIATTIFIIAIGLPLSALLMFLTIVAFSLSEILIKKGKVNLGSWFATIGYIFSCVVTCFFIPTALSIHIGYRVFGFMMVMATLNSMIS
nr:hypothetical protein [Treponemataceae bacterium]